MNIEAEICSILEECTQSYFQRHGGRVTLEAFRDGVVYVRLHGACAGCPAADLSMQEYVQERLCEKGLPITRIELMRMTNPELLAAARRLLNHETDGRERTTEI